MLVLQGSPLFGAAFALPTIRLETVSALGVFGIASFLLIAHIRTFNDWAGLAADLNDPNGSARVFSTKGVASRGLLGFSINVFIAGLLLFGTIVRLITGTTTAKGLAVSCRLDRRKYPTGRKVTDEEMKTIRMTPQAFHGEWNYVIRPRRL